MQGSIDTAHATGAAPRAGLRARLAHSGGYSLIETAIVLSVLAVVLGATTSVTVSAAKVETAQQVRTTAQTTVRLALDRLRRDVHCGASARPTAPTDDVTIQVSSGCAPGVSGSYVEWCVKPVPGTPRDWALWRITNPTVVSGLATPGCDTTAGGAFRLADGLVYDNAAGQRTSSPFFPGSGAGGSGLLPWVTVRLASNPAVTSAGAASTDGWYVIQEALVLLEGVRA